MLVGVEGGSVIGSKDGARDGQAVGSRVRTGVGTGVGASVTNPITRIEMVGSVLARKSAKILSARLGAVGYGSRRTS